MQSFNFSRSCGRALTEAASFPHNLLEAVFYQLCPALQVFQLSQIGIASSWIRKTVYVDPHIIGRSRKTCAGHHNPGSGITDGVEVARLGTAQSKLHDADGAL